MELASALGRKPDLARTHDAHPILDLTSVIYDLDLSMGEHFSRISSIGPPGSSMNRDVTCEGPRRRRWPVRGSACTRV